MRRRGERGEESSLKWRLTGEIGVGKNEGRITSLGFQIDSPCDPAHPPLGKFPGGSPQGPERDVHVDICKGVGCAARRVSPRRWKPRRWRLSDQEHSKEVKATNSGGGNRIDLKATVHSRKEQGAW